MRHAQQYFRKYHKAATLYFTTDDLAFTVKEAAEQHALTLDDDLVIEMTRREARAALADIATDEYESNDADDFFSL